MKKKEYLEALKKALDTIDLETKQEILEDYEEHFQMGLKNGKSEEEICEKLGSIEEFVEEIKQMTNRTVVAVKEEKKVPAVIQTEKEPQEFECTNLVIDAKHVDVIIEKSTNNCVDIRYEDNNNLKHQMMFAFDCYQEGNTIYAKIRSLHKYSFHNGRKSVKIYILIPECMESMKIESSSGDIQIKDIKCLLVNICTGSGDVQLNNMVAGECILHSSSGDLEGNSLSNSKLEMETSSGDIMMKGITAEKMQACSSSGDLKFQHLKVSSIKCKSTSGDMELMNLSCEKIKANTTSGDIMGTELIAKQSTIYTTSGDLRIFNASYEVMEISTTSGDLEGKEITAEESRLHTNSGDLNITKLSGRKIEAQTGSGELHLDMNFQQCNIHTGSGDQVITNHGDIEGTFRAGSGDITLYLDNGGNGYRVSVKSGSGDKNLYYGTEKLRRVKNGKYSFGAEGSKLDISSGSGDIKING